MSTKNATMTNRRSFLKTVAAAPLAPVGAVVMAKTTDPVLVWAKGAWHEVPPPSPLLARLRAVVNAWSGLRVHLGPVTYGQARAAMMQVEGILHWRTGESEEHFLFSTGESAEHSLFKGIPVYWDASISEGWAGVAFGMPDPYSDRPFDVLVQLG